MYTGKISQVLDEALCFWAYSNKKSPNWKSYYFRHRKKVKKQVHFDFLNKNAENYCRGGWTKYYYLFKSSSLFWGIEGIISKEQKLPECYILVLFKLIQVHSSVRECRTPKVHARSLFPWGRVLINECICL